MNITFEEPSLSFSSGKRLPLKSSSPDLCGAPAVIIYGAVWVLEPVWKFSENRKPLTSARNRTVIPQSWSHQPNHYDESFSGFPCLERSRFFGCRLELVHSARSNPIFLFAEFYVLLTVHPRMILANNQLDAQFFMYIYFYSLHVSATYKCDDTRGCIIQFWPPDDEHMVLETCRGMK